MHSHPTSQIEALRESGKLVPTLSVRHRLLHHALRLTGDAKSAWRLLHDTLVLIREECPTLPHDHVIPEQVINRMRARHLHGVTHH